MSKRTAVIVDIETTTLIDELKDKLNKLPAYEGVKLTRTAVFRMATTLGINEITKRTEEQEKYVLARSDGTE